MREETMSENNKPSTESWDDYLDTYLKAEHVKDLKKQTFVISVDSALDRDGNNMLLYKVNHDGKKYLWQPNKTNMSEFVKLGIKGPKDLLNKNLYFEKIKVQNPATGKRVDSFVIVQVQ